MNKEKYYLALDLELNNSSDGSTPNPPIIQVGVAYGNYYDYLANTIKTRKWYIDPKEPIFPFITSLTGITDDDIKNFAISHDEIAQELSFLVSCCKIGNPITWGGGDITELKNEFNARDVHFPHFGRRWIDVKTYYTFDMIADGKNPAGSLRSAFARYKMKFIGEPHRADNDALNTLRLFFNLIERHNRLQMIVKDIKEL